MRQTNQIDEPNWDDVRDRDALIRKLAHVIRGELFEVDRRPNIVLIDDQIEEALVAICGPAPSGSIEHRDAALIPDGLPDHLAGAARAIAE